MRRTYQVSNLQWYLMFGPALIFVVILLFSIARRIVESGEFISFAYLLVFVPFIYLPINIYVKRNKNPVVKIIDDCIFVQNFWGNPVKIAPISAYQCVFSNDFIAFRKDEEEEVLLDHVRVKRGELRELTEVLKSQKFSSFIS